MEAATPLRQPHVRTVGDRLAIDGLTVEDETAVRLVRDREESGEDPAKTVTDAIEIGTRVLDREQAAANAEFVRNEFGKVSKEVEDTFVERAGHVAEHLAENLDRVFDPDSGSLARSLEELFSDGSARAVQHRVRELVAEALAKSREDLVRQFSAADGRNPLADFKSATVRSIREAAERQDKAQLALREQLAQLEKELQGLRAEQDKLEQVQAERERGTAKGRTYEEQVAEAVDVLALAQGDCAEAVGDLRGATGKTGDVVVGIAAADGPERGRIVFEAKDRRLTGPKAIEELDAALRERDADFAVLVVPGEEEVPARLHPLREYNGDKLIVTYDPEEGSRLPLEVGYRLARARVLMERAEAGEVDAAAVAECVERAVQALADERKAKSQLTGAKTNIDNAYKLIDSMAARAREHLAQIDTLIRR